MARCILPFLDPTKLSSPNKVKSRRYVGGETTGRSVKYVKPVKRETPLNSQPGVSKNSAWSAVNLSKFVKARTVGPDPNTRNDLRLTSGVNSTTFPWNISNSIALRLVSVVIDSAAFPNVEKNG